MGVGDGVAATGVPRMTAPETLQREPRALDPAVVSNCGFGITGAAGIEAAVVTEEWADAVTIAPDKDDQDLAHCSTLFQCWSKIDRNCALNSRAAPCLPITTISRPLKRSRLCRKLSRTIRLRRLRSTAARAQRVDITSPSRGSSPVLARANTVNALDALRSAWSKTRWYSLDLTSLLCRVKRALRTRKGGDGVKA